MRKPTLYLRPLNGLCNRMRAVASGRALAAATGARLVVLWDVDEGLSAKYQDLFVHDGSFEVVNIVPGRSLRDAVLLLLFGELQSVRGISAQWITRTFFRNRILRQVRPEDVDDRDLERWVQAAPRTLITSWWSFYGGAKTDFSFFAMQPSEQAVVDEVSAAFAPNTVGVHIRRTDNANAILRSPTSAFIGAMRAEVARDPAVRFFLATDCADTEQTLKDLFGEHIVTRPRQMTRSSSQGMRDAIVDLYLLARTRRILGSFYSTFSEVGAILGDIGWVTVTHDKTLIGKCNSAVLVVPVADGMTT